MHYVAFIHKEDESEFGISFPDFPGCIAVASDLDAVLAEGAKALAFHAEGMREDGEDIPAPSSIKDIFADSGLAGWAEGAMVVLVPLVTDQGSPRRINITMDPGLLRAVDDAADRRGMNRSAFLASAARKEVSGLW
ncbi:type II toxin-antitoxin system HicB family antitoxin [uncultured Roseobacter sp.]|uniref:type II toxin-antitoxin system HicB family antitoxin n=1 Tax=uncultured Roseobacter sp. TaxID=114847 RepID=UPI00262018B0|nr:type II toxin-antitoxin system HicB family antitoxin [uncultured Roseobacter sp.]